ncbi:hypothetical protein LNP05_15830 [Klebsiella pneumoniae subsp. pneumoniae]|nr:hypothetical protein [Klebsiella pneumoniae subsp. pneumoniae]
MLPPAGLTSVCSWKNFAVCDCISAAAISAGRRLEDKLAKRRDPRPVAVILKKAANHLWGSPCAHDHIRWGWPSAP